MEPWLPSRESLARVRLKLHFGNVQLKKTVFWIFAIVRSEASKSQIREDFSDENVLWERRKSPQTSFHRRSSIRSFSRFVYAISFPEHHLNWRNFTKDSSLKISQGICCVDGDNLIWMAHSISTNWRSHCEDGRLIEFVWALIKCIIDCMCAKHICISKSHKLCITLDALHSMA